MNSAELKRAKRDVRRRMLSLRDALSPAERARLGATVVERFLAIPEVAGADTVLAFWSFGSELPTAPLIEELHGRGVRVALPRVANGEIEVRAYRPGDPVAETSFGAFEPIGGDVLEAIEIDAIAVPAVAFDRDCRRVGYGGGFYDRLLSKTSDGALHGGIGYGLQLLPRGDSLPAGRFDRQVDLVVTEDEVVRCRST